MISIRPMRSDEYHTFEESAVAFYADESARAGRINRDDSLKWARVETKKILTKGIETPTHLFYVVEDGSNQSVGYIWCGQDSDLKARAFLFTILIFTEHRDQGYGHQALKLLEQDLKGKGYRSIGLHVYTFNERAVHLYRKQGYRETDLVMSKEI